MIKLGLTGGICSGKSSASKYLSTLGNVKVLDADLLAHQVYKKGTVSFQQIIDRFPDVQHPENGEIDRRALAKLVFQDKKVKHSLEQIVWPEVYNIVDKEIKRSEAEANENKSKQHGQKKVLVIDAALLLEANFQHLCDQVWVLVVPREVAIQRMMERNGFSAEEAMKRLAMQMTNEERSKLADVVINTDNSKEVTQQRIRTEYEKLLRMI
eukprot:TRINITY_DN4361_c0_g2_i7.p1 TRINITY_DN4361_c0_g2~~TRINITY_DN4361_c0_g2_i7.p1  ORF type:complete len:219 (+),score=57.40 TRINITY_DN4361_c0_g2_i7:27-659(+)